MLGVILLASCAATKTPEDIQLDRIRHNQAVAALKAGDFVLEAYQLQFRRGESVNVNSITNFIAVRNGNATVQTSFNNAQPGSNGLGGITLEGRSTDVKTSTSKNGNVSVEMHISGSLLSARVELTLFSGSTRATAVVYPTFSGNRLTLNGNIVPTEQSKVFKGEAAY